jgi:hypothetical protein
MLKSMSSISGVILITASLLGWTAKPVLANEKSNWTLGAGVGLSAGLNSGSSTGFGYGAEVGYQAARDLQVGVEVNSGQIAIISGGNGSTNMTSLAVFSNFYPSDYFYIGLNAGLGFLNATTTQTGGVISTSQSTNVALGGQLGFDFLVGEGIYIGPELRFANVFTTLSSTTALYSLAMFKYRF